jgi:hypothetical protein
MSPQMESQLREFPGGPALCERIRHGSDPWPEIAFALIRCTWFPTKDFNRLLANGDFDVRWPLTFTAWYLAECGASVDQGCADFLSAATLWEQARDVLPEYTGPDWLAAWRSRFEQAHRQMLDR